MTAARNKQEFKALARELAGESIVTKALARFLEQIFEEVHEQEIKPLLQEIASLREANNTWVALYGPSPPLSLEGRGGAT